MPSFKHTKVDPNRLSATAINIDNTLKNVENALSAIDDALHDSLYPTWKDVASILFFQKYSIDANVFASQLQALRAFNEQLKTAAGIFDSADNKARELANNLKIG